MLLLEGEISCMRFDWVLLERKTPKDSGVEYAVTLEGFRVAPGRGSGSGCSCYFGELCCCWKGTGRCCYLVHRTHSCGYCCCLFWRTRSCWPYCLLRRIRSSIANGVDGVIVEHWIRERCYCWVLNPFSLLLLDVMEQNLLLVIKINRVVAGKGLHCCWKGRIRSVALALLVVAATEETNKAD